jgi:hypothetical protein
MKRSARLNCGKRAAKLVGLSSLTARKRKGCAAGIAAGLRRWAATVLLLALSCCASEAAQVLAQVDRDTVTLGDGVTLTLVFDGLRTQGRPVLPDIPGFQVDQSQVSQQSFFINGAVRQSFGYTLVPTAEGDVTIPELAFAVGGQTFKTQPIKIKVVRPGASVPGPTPDAPQAFATLSGPRPEVYFGEVFLLEEKLYFLPNRQALLQPNWGPFEGSFRVTPLGGYVESEIRTNNQPYRVRSYRALATPLKTGRFDSGAVSLLMAFGRISPFGEFWADQRFRLAANPVVMQVLSVPANAPPGFNGAVGTYSLRVSASPTNVAAGDPITVKVQIAGRGQFETLALPAQPAWREFKPYPPSSTIVTNDQIGLACVKTFEQVIIPQNHEIKSLPSLLFSFFDPDAKVFRTLTGPAIPLQVRPSTGTGLPLPTLAGVTNRAEQAEKPPEIAPLKVHLGELSAARPPLFERGWFLGLQAMPPALWLSLLVRRRYREALSRNPRLLRRRQVDKVISAGMQQLREQAAAGKSDEFFVTVFRLLQERIGERLDLPASAITEAVIDERLRPLELEPNLLARLHELFQECNLARYAASRASGALEEVIPRLEQALQGLETIAEPVRK